MFDIGKQVPGSADRYRPIDLEIISIAHAAATLNALKARPAYPLRLPEEVMTSDGLAAYLDFAYHDTLSAEERWRERLATLHALDPFACAMAIDNKLLPECFVDSRPWTYCWADGALKQFPVPLSLPRMPSGAQSSAMAKNLGDGVRK